MLAVPAAHAGVDAVVVGAFLGGSTAGGDPAPDNDGAFFGFGVPVINDAGEVAFPCSFTTGSGGTAIVRGSTAPGDRHIVVRQGNPAPDGNGNFGGFDPTLATAAINGNGQVAFPTTFVGTFGTGDTSGIVRGDVGPDHLTLLARSGQTVDGVQVGSLTNQRLALNAAGTGRLRPAHRDHPERRRFEHRGGAGRPLQFPTPRAVSGPSGIS